MRVFFDYVHPTCPIFDQVDCMRVYESSCLSPLILNAIFFISVLYCPTSLINPLGFMSRYLASLSYYRWAKASYDAGYETDGIATLQASILLSHHCDGPFEQKDTYHWLGVAVGLAQSLGMHRK